MLYLTDALLSRLAKIVGADNLLTATPDRELYDHDELSGLHALPEAVAKPANTDEVAAIMRLANEALFPVTPRGLGTGLSGGSLPVRGGLVLSLERMNRILEIDESNLMAMAQPGVITGDLQREVEARGLFYPVDPASMDSCSLGGNLAENAGGPRAVKYGVTRDYVTGIEAVMAGGEIVRYGGKIVKNVAGYDLAHLLIGSEGTLGIITEITLRLIPLPPERVDLLAPFEDFHAAIDAVSAILTEKRIVPTVLEFLDRLSYQACYDFIGKEAPYGDAGAQLIIGLDGTSKDEITAQYEAISELCLAMGARDVLIAETPANRERLWESRRVLLEALKAKGLVEAEDVVVPRHAIPEFVGQIAEIEARTGFRLAQSGHAGDGNVHVAILRMDMEKEIWEARLERVVEEIFAAALALGGTITGEHGIGYIKRKYLPLTAGPAEIEIMRRLKQAMDPNGILNPEKILP